MKKPLVVLFMLALITGYSYSQWVEQVSGTTAQLSSISACLLYTSDAADEL